VVLGVGDPDAAVLGIDGEAARLAQARSGRGSHAGTGDKVGLAEHEIGRGAVVQPGGIVEDQHAVVAVLGGIDLAAAVAKDGAHVAHAGLCGGGGFAGEIGLAEDAVGRSAVGFFAGIIITDDAVVGELADPNRAGGIDIDIVRAIQSVGGGTAAG